MYNNFSYLADRIGERLDWVYNALMNRLTVRRLVSVSFTEGGGKNLRIKLQPVTRAYLVSELFAVAEVELGKLLGVEVEELSRYYEEEELVGWSCIVKGVRSVNELEVLMRVRGLI